METDSVKIIAERVFGKPVLVVTQLPVSGSSRRYYRLNFSDNSSILAAYNSEIRENEAFIQFASHFKEQGLPVPEILHVESDQKLYFINDLGNTTLYNFIIEEGHIKPEKQAFYYQKAIDYLLKFQFSKPPDYQYCFPRAAFDRTSMMWDLNYFKYYFLKLAYISFDEQKLEHDFIAWCDTLSQIPSHYFLYRDFQSRNIMINGDELSFLDFQGGRRGALQYDLASLLYDAKANLSDTFRKEMLDYYCQQLEQKQLGSPGLFRNYYYHFVLMRIMQAFGAYGYRGFYEKKPHFLQSVPLAAANLVKLLTEINFQNAFPELSNVWNQIATKFTSASQKESIDEKLHIKISSFSFKKGYPEGHPEHGGGFIFDCRALPNPGREEKYKHLTGLDDDVVRFLEDSREVSYFIDACADLVCLSTDNYLGRGFSQLAIAFGCTGGQHRSVYCASQMEKALKSKYGNDIHVSIVHRELQ
ncbi:MAG: phosphotransferase enzyme family protein [Bacteroidetes bacterium HGW-Bacteroidetes-6]|jgi:aminoglycoside/choline kinase family phosphotransferase|nr:MAG: phosphotransferase enzyme family protein [Bacteroidetes bacterium HGW-Bacteroidetes-6]